MRALDPLEGQQRGGRIGRAPQRDDLRTLGHVPHTAWAALERDVQQLLDRQIPTHHADAAAAALRWNALFNQLTRNDAQLRHKLLTASANEPLLQAGSPLSAPVRAYLQAALTQAMPTPTLTAAAPAPEAATPSPKSH